MSLMPLLYVGSPSSRSVLLTLCSYQREAYPSTSTSNLLLLAKKQYHGEWSEYHHGTLQRRPKLNKWKVIGLRPKRIGLLLTKLRIKDAIRGNSGAGHLLVKGLEEAKRVTLGVYLP